MRKFISIILSVSLSIVNLSVIGFAIDNEDSLKKFTNGVIELVNEYDKADVKAPDDEISLGTGSVGEYNSANTPEGEQEDLSKVEYTNRLIVKSEKEVESLDAVGHVCGYNDLHILQFDNSESFNEAVEYYLDLPYVEYVEEDLYCSIDEETTEATTEVSTEAEVTAFNPTQTHSDLFGFTALNEYLEENPLNYSDTLEIAVVDSGVQNDHDYLKDKVVPTGFDSVNGVSCYDDRGHGTHVAGIIAANTPENVKIKPYKVLDSAGRGTVTQVYLGVLAAVEDGVDIINMSLSIRGDNETLHEAIRTAYNAGIIVVASAGNKGVNLENVPYSPACYDEVLTVTACTNSKAIASFSNYGSTCDASAPGVSVNSTYLGNTYKEMSGTSMSAPFISAAMSYIMMSFSYDSVDEYFKELRINTIPCFGLPSGSYINAEFLTREKEKSANPIVSYSKKTFSESFDLSITCTDADAVIYYNTSLMPNDEYVVYTEPIHVNYDMTLKTFTVKKGGEQSTTFTYNYTRTAQSSTLFTVASDGTLTGYSGNEADIVVPSSVGGTYVKKISSDVFAGNTGIRSVMLMSYVTEIQDNAFNGCTNLEFIRAKGVTSIGNNAFKNCSSLNSFSGSVVQSIGDYAFSGCNNLKTFDFLKVQSIGASAFENVSDITGFSSNSIISIGDRAFYNTGITNINLPLIEEIGSYTFSYCNNIEVVTLPRTTSIGVEAFANCPKITSITADAVTYLGENAFENCTEIDSISLNSLEYFNEADTFELCKALEYFSAVSLKKVNDNMFKGCENLSEVVLDSLTEIGEYSFYGTAIESAPLSLVEAIGEYAFYGTAIETAPCTSATYIGAYAFADCKNLLYVDFGSLLSFDKRILDGSTEVLTVYAGSATEFVFDKSEDFVSLNEMLPHLTVFDCKNAEALPDNAFRNCKNLHTASIDNVVVIGNYAFEGCTELTEVVANKATTVGNRAFADCPKLAEVSANEWVNVDLSAFNGSEGSVKSIKLNAMRLPDVYIADDYNFSSFLSLEEIFLGSIQELPDGCFNGCDKLKTVSCESAELIGDNAFDNCVSLTAFYGNGVKTLDFNVFNDCSNLEILCLGITEFTEEYTADFSLSSRFPDLTQFNAPDVADVPDYTFMNCTSLSSFNLSNANKIGDYAFANTAVSKVGNYSNSQSNNISNNYTNAVEFGSHAFMNCKNLYYVGSKNLNQIGDGTFEGCGALSEVYAPYLYNVPDNAFKSCANLKTTTLTYTEVIGDYAFYGTSIKMNSSDYLKSVGAYAFAGINNSSNSSLDLTFTSLVDIGEFAFSDTPIKSLTLNSLEELDNNLAGISINHLYLPKIKSIPDGYFENNLTLNTFSGEVVENVGISTFSGCSSLVNVYLDSLSEICDNLFYKCSSLKKVSFNNVNTIGNNAFGYCSGLTEVSASKLKVVKDYAFYECTSLKNFNCSSLQEVGVFAFANCHNLTSINTNSIKILKAGAFKGCQNVKNWGFNSLEELGTDALYGTGVKGIYKFPNLKTVDVGGFNSLALTRTIMPSVVELNDLPASGLVAIGSSLESMNNCTDTEATVYSPKGTVGEAYCKSNGIAFKTFTPFSALLSTPDKYVSEIMIGIDVIGFDLEYQWYVSGNPDGSDGKPFTFNNFIKDDSMFLPGLCDYPYFYCIATSTENGNVVEIKSPVFRNMRVLMQSANGSRVEYSEGTITSDKTNNTEISDLVTINSDFTTYSLPSMVIGGNGYYGTGSTIAVYDQGNLYKNYTVIINNDVNGDSIVDVIDASQVERAVNGFEAFEGVSLTAADSDGDNSIDVDDYQAVVNAVLAN